MLIPNIWGILRTKPKLAPDANSMILLGPGVAEETKAKIMSAPIDSKDIQL